MKTTSFSAFSLQPLAFAILPAIALVVTAPSTPAQTSWGSALSFDGVDDHVLAPPGVWFSGDFTIEARVYVRSHKSWARLIDFGNGESSDNVLLSLSGGPTGQPILQTYPNATWYSVPQLPTNRWVHLAVTLQGSSATFFYDGVPQATNTVQPPAAVNRTMNYIGRSHWSTDDYVDSIFDDLRIWNVARSQAEIQDNMLRPLSGSEANLLAYWNFNEGTGTAASDSTPNGFHATLINGPTWTTSTWPQAPTGWGSALSFDGVDDYLQMPAASWFSNEFTIEAWVYERSYTNEAAIVSFRNPSVYFDMLFLRITDGYPYVAWPCQGDWQQSIGAWGNRSPLNRWVHLAATLKSHTVSLYVNGTLATWDTQDEAINPANWTANFIGRIFTRYINAALEDVRIWSVGRTAEQIEESMWHPLSGAEPGLVAYYPFNEGAGGIAHDATTNHLDALFVNGPTWLIPDVPVPARLGDQTIDQGASITRELTLTQPGLDVQNLAATVVSLNPVLLPNTDTAIQLVGSGFTRMLTLTPVPEQSGSAPIQVTVSDGVSTVSYTFTLNVRPRWESPLLRLTDAAPVAPQTLRLWFRDDGTGSTNYWVEFRKDLSPTNTWEPLTTVAPGVFQADVVPPPGDKGFFRVTGLRVLTASFDSAGTKVDEGAGLLAPVVVFNGPFQGTLRYTVSGTLGTNDYTTLTGELQVNGTTAAIPIQLADNSALNQLRYLTLRLELGSGYQIGASRQSTFIVEDNDADWQGQLQMPGGPLASATAQIVYETNNVRITNSAAIPLNNAAPIDFLLRIQRSGNTLVGTLASAGSGFFPPQGVPAQLSVNAASFSATANSIWLPPDTTPLDAPVWLDLQLTAQNGLPNQTNTPTQVAGSAALAVRYEGLPHLDTTNLGTFLLLKPPGKPSTNEVKLVTAP